MPSGNKEKEDAEVEKKKRKRGMYYLSNSFFLTAVLLLLQVFVWGGLYFITGLHFDHVTGLIIEGILLLVNLSMIGYVILWCPTNAYQISWLILLVLAPALALVMYVILRLVPGTAHLTAKINERALSTNLHLTELEGPFQDLSMMNNKYVGVFRYLENACRFPAYYGKDTTYYDTGEDAIDGLCEALEEAEDFIFMEYFIVSEGQVMDRVLDILERKSREGVEVRFLYDGLCALKLPKNYHKEIQARGINCHVFSPIKPLLSSYQNSRDHRKIAVIDGKVGFTGGFNLADEYANLIVRFGHWKDAGIRITGSGVQSLTAMFLQVWSVVTGTVSDEYARYMEVREDVEPSGTILAPYADAPENDKDTASDVYCQILDLAEDYVHIMTPYLIVDERMRKSLELAAQRGVDVKLLLPRIPDKKIAFMVARSFYPDLLRAGVKIYEYTPGFVHSKIFVSDDCISTVGTVNLDFRSLFLHFENSILVYDREVALDIERDFDETIQKSERIYYKTYCSFKWYERAAGRIMRVFGPLM